MSQSFDYDIYWRQLRSPQVRSHLMAREEIFLKWIKEGSRVLDAAVGNSLLPSIIQEKKKSRVTVYDISPIVIEKQKERGLEAWVRDLTDARFSLTENYDYIILSEILEHLAVPEVLLEKIRVNTQYLMISIPNIAFYHHRLSLIGGRFPKQFGCHPAEHLRYWSHKDFLKWLSDLNLKTVGYEVSNGLDIFKIRFYKYFFPNLLGNQICYLVKT